MKHKGLAVARPVGPVMRVIHQPHELGTIKPIKDQGHEVLALQAAQGAANLSAPELLGHVERSGGVAVAAHPFRPGRPVVKELMEQGLCQVVEGVNGRNRDEDNLRALAWQELYGSHLTGGSDAHSRAEVGRVSTLFQTEIRSRADLIEALRSGKFSPDTLLQPYALCA